MNSRLQLYPLPRIGIVLILGIVFGDCLHPFIPSFVWLLCVLVGLVAYFLLQRQSLLQSSILLLCVFFLGSWLVQVHEDHRNFIDTNTEITYQAVVASKPVAHERVATFDLLVITDKEPLKIKASLRHTSHETSSLPLLGSGLTVHSRIKPITPFVSSSRFDYVRWAQVHGYRGQTFIYDEKWQQTKVSLATLSWLQRTRLKALEWRERLLQSLVVKGKDSSAASVMAAMALGDKSGLDKTTQSVFSLTGASHVLALSGLHLGILYAVLMLLLPRRRIRAWSQTMVILVVWTYVLLTGFPTSLVRSATMFTIMGLVSLTHRSSVSLNTLALSAIIMLVANPLSLWDIGFQLSFASVFSILLIFQWLDSWGLMFRSTVQKGFATFVVLPIAAQIGTFPLVLYHFGQFSCYFLMSNLVAVPATMFILVGTMVSFVALPLPWLHSYVFQLLAGVVDMLQRYLSWVASLPYATFTEIKLSSLQVMLIYLLIVSLFGIVHHVFKALENGKALKTLGLERAKTMYG